MWRRDVSKLGGMSHEHETNPARVAVAAPKDDANQLIRLWEQVARPTLAAMYKEIGQLKRHVRLLEERISKMADDLATQLSQVNQALDDQAQVIAGVNVSVGQVNDRVTAAEGQLNAAIKDLNTQIAALQAAGHPAAPDLSGILSRIQAGTNQLTGAKTALDAIDAATTPPATDPGTTPPAATDPGTTPPVTQPPVDTTQPPADTTTAPADGTPVAAPPVLGNGTN